MTKAQIKKITELDQNLQTEICNECGESVKGGTARFINRVVDFNTILERADLGKAFPEGDFICEYCDQTGGGE